MTLNIESLSPELLTRTFYGLTDLPSIARAARVCKAWQQILTGNDFWKAFHLRNICIVHWVGSEPPVWRRYVAIHEILVRTFWKINAKTPANDVACGVELYQKGYLNEALKMLKQVDDPEAGLASQHCLADIFFKLQLYEESLQALRGDSQSLIIRGDIYLVQQNLNRAERCYLAALEINATVDAHLGLMVVYQRSKSTQQYQWHRERASTLLSSPLLQAKFCALAGQHDTCLEKARIALDQGKEKDLAAYLAAQSIENLLRQKSLPYINFVDTVKEYYEMSLKYNPFNLKVIFAYLQFLEFETRVQKEHDQEYSLEKYKLTLDKSLSLLVQCERLNSRHAGAIYSMGIVYAQLERFEEAYSKILQAKELGAKTENLYIVLLDMALRIKPFIYNQVEKFSQEALEAFPGCKRLQILFCRIAMLHPRQLNSDQALEIANLYVKNNPEGVEGFFVLAGLLENKKEHKEAEKTYRDARLLFEKKEATKDNTFSERAELAQRLRQRHAIHLGITRCLVRQKKVEEAQKHALEVITEYLLPVTFSQLEELLLYACQQQTSASLLEKLGGLYFAQYKHGIPEKNILRKQQCVEACLKAIAADRKNLTPHLQLGELYLYDKEFDEALEWATWVLDQEPQNLKGMTLYVEIVAKKGDASLVKLGMERARTILDQNKDATNVWLGLFEMHRIAGSAPKAKDDFIDFFTKYLDCSFSVTSEGKISISKKNDIEDVFLLLLEQTPEFQEAVCDAVLQKEKKCYPLQCLKGQILLQRKEIIPAADHWKAAFVLKPQNPILSLLLQLYLSVHEEGLACQIANQIVYLAGEEVSTSQLIDIGTKFPYNFSIQNNIGVLLFFRGKLLKAIPFLKRATTMQPGLDQALCLLSEIYNKTGDVSIYGYHPGEDLIPSSHGIKLDSLCYPGKLS